ncbi:hypothetical protein GC209_15115 [bacterium]|nr:hypothetical protein [bacterium]
MPPAEAGLLRATYQGADVILEYGAGGSTLVAASSAARSVITVESDRMWLLKMAAWFKTHPAPVPVILHHGNIGPTRKWGFPAQIAKSERWPSYALSVWDRADFAHPDVVLVDGRFRLACMLATLFRIERPVRLLCDDYAARASYHLIETLVGAPEMTGRMAAFTFTPQSFPIAQMGWIMAAFANPA